MRMILKGKRYDVGDKLGFLEATVDFALKREELKDGFLDYLRRKSAKNMMKNLKKW